MNRKLAASVFLAGAVFLSWSGIKGTQALERSARETNVITEDASRTPSTGWGAFYCVWISLWRPGGSQGL